MVVVMVVWATVKMQSSESEEIERERDLTSLLLFTGSLLCGLVVYSSIACVLRASC